MNNGNPPAGPTANGDATRWAAIAGRWQFEGSSASYLGAERDDAIQPRGLAVTSWNLTDGSVRVRIKFSEIEATGQVSAGIVLGFQSERTHYLLVQMGAWGTAYSIGEFVPGAVWRAIESAGSALNLEVNKEYELEVRLAGQEIRVYADGVSVIGTVLGHPLNGSQVGLFAWGKEAISFTRVIVEPAKPLVFVAMQFGPQFESLFKDVIQPLERDFDVRVLRIDEVAGPGIIFEDIKKHIAEASVVIAEITAPNQNVFYELGYAHALNKPTILLAQRGKELPFDIRSYRVIFYGDSIGGKAAVEANIGKHLRAILPETAPVLTQ